MGMTVQLDDGAHGDDDADVGNEAVVAEINITPLTDVFLVLLIIFMVTSTALVESEVASRAGMKVVLRSGIPTRFSRSPRRTSFISEPRRSIRPTSKRRSGRR
jgi:Biopolymer transport protein ExbD/TolR